MREEIKKLLEKCHSEAYIEAVMYGKFKSVHGMRDINRIIKEVKEELNKK